MQNNVNEFIEINNISKKDIEIILLATQNIIESRSILSWSYA